jgi:hypothetical protein
MARSNEPPEILRTGAMPGHNDEENEIYLAEQGFGIPQAQVRRIVDEIMADKTAPASDGAEGGRPSGIPQGYGDERLS